MKVRLVIQVEVDDEAELAICAKNIDRRDTTKALRCVQDAFDHYYDSLPMETVKVLSVDNYGPPPKEAPTPHARPYPPDSR